LKEDWQIEEQLIVDNLLRRHLNDAQKVKAGLKLEEIERRKARERQLSKLKQFRETVVQNFAPREANEKGKTRDIVAQKVGFGSGFQYEKAKKVFLEAPDYIKRKWGFCFNAEKRKFSQIGNESIAWISNQRAKPRNKRRSNQMDHRKPARQKKFNSRNEKVSDRQEV